MNHALPATKRPHVQGSYGIGANQNGYWQGQEKKIPPQRIDIFETYELRTETLWVKRVSQGSSEFRLKIFSSNEGLRYDSRSFSEMKYQTGQNGWSQRFDFKRSLFQIKY